MSRQLRAAGFVIYRKIANQVEFLLLKASYPPYHWSPPKGHVDPGENDMETALRETQEEAGFTKDHLNIMSFTKTLQYNVRDCCKSSIYWLAELRNPDTPLVLSKEHTEFVWLPLEQACARAGFQDFNAMLVECQTFIDAKK
ncbi:hypothetical protein B566_EDAN006602 [Ephemera danica]|nr:hypothetical protein B566_EDAN006602 [Ephemera danica]